MNKRPRALIICTCLAVIFSYNLRAQEGSSSSLEAKPVSIKAEKRNPEDWASLKNKDLLFRLSTDKQVYRAGEKVTLLAELKNDGEKSYEVAPISQVFGNFSGEAIKIVGPDKVKYVGMHKNCPPPKMVLLKPNTTISAECVIDQKFRGFGTKGKYTITSTASPVAFNVIIEIIEAEQQD